MGRDPPTRLSVRRIVAGWPDCRRSVLCVGELGLPGLWVGGSGTAPRDSPAVRPVRVRGQQCLNSRARSRTSVTSPLLSTISFICAIFLERADEQPT